MTREQMRDKVSANIAAVKEAQKQSAEARETENLKRQSLIIESAVDEREELLNDLADLREFALIGANDLQTRKDLDAAAERIKEALCK